MASRLSQIPFAAQDAIVRYAASLDDRDWDAYRDCFARDAEFLDFAPEPIRGVDAWLRFVQETLSAYSATQHLVGPARIGVEEGEVRLRAPLQAQHFFREPKGRIFTLWGVYRSTVVEIDGCWRIRRHRLEVQAIRISEPGAGS